jgi:hypothetical protein
MFPKPGIVRLEGEDMTALRLARFMLDMGRCQECGIAVYLDFPDWHPMKMDLAHVVSRGSGGPDTLENTRTNCHRCHMLKHAGNKPCPPKRS